MPFGKLLDKLRAEGAAVNSASLRKRLNRLVDDDKWKRTRVGNQTYYWANKKPK